MVLLYCLLFLIKVIILQKKKKEDWLHTNNHITCAAKDRNCHLIVDGDSCKNVAWWEVVNKLKLCREKERPTPYKLSLFYLGNVVPVTTNALVYFFYWRTLSQ